MLSVKWRSHFQAKLLCAFLLCTLIPLCIIGGISYSVSYHIAEQRILNASISSDEQLNMQINERLSHVESVANALQYDMYTLGQSDSTMEYLSALTDIRNDVSLFKSTFNLYYACIFLPSDRLGANERLYFFPLEEFEEYDVPETALENPGTSSIWFYQKNVSVPLLISGKLTKKIRLLSRAMEHLTLDSPKEDLSELIPPGKDPETYDEIDRLGLTFQKMQLSLKDNMQSILDLSLTEEKLKYQLLQSQINPHFLYNILGSIQTCQSIGKLDIANQMLTNLTRFYRMTLRKSGDLISIKDELEIARLYLEIEKLCHNDNLSWEFDLEDGIENFLICKFTLQPFLENSILHGLSQKTPRIHLHIAAAYGEDTVIITIEDNGVGISEKQLAELRHTLDSKAVNYEKHFGIGNVNKRISSPHFGNGHISIESRLYHGTVITIEFDQMEEDYEESNDC